MALRWACAWWVVCLAAPASASAPERYIRVELTASGDRLDLTLSDGSNRQLALDRMDKQFDDVQVQFGQPAIASDGLRVGWLALYPNCCTSYPLPMSIVIYRNGMIEARIHGDGHAIINWRFNDAGDSVFLCQRPPHGDFAGHYVRQKIGKRSPEEELDRTDDDAVDTWPAWAVSVRC